MFQEESIYNILPPKQILPAKEKLYKSMYPHWIAPTGSTFILKNTSYPGVANMGGALNFPRGAHPIKGNWSTIGRPKGGYKQPPEKFYKKGHQYKILPPQERIKSAYEIRKPPVATVRDKPIMGLKTDKNFITANAMEAVLMQPKHKKIKNDGDLDYYLDKKNYGKVPKYINRARSATQKEIKRYQEVQDRNEMYERNQKKVIENEELTLLREGLEKRLQELRHEYGKIAHRRKFDTIVMREKKENLEKEIEIVEKDIEKLNSDNVVVDLTR